MVGQPEKVGFVESLGADTVYDKSRQIWTQECERSYPEGFDLVLDANGVETIRQSYHLL